MHWMAARRSIWWSWYMYCSMAITQSGFFSIRALTVSFTLARLPKAKRASKFLMDSQSSFNSFAIGRTASQLLWPGNAMEGSWLMPILARPWAASFSPFSVHSSARGTRALLPPCCTTRPRRSACLQKAFNTRAISSFMFLLSVLERTANAEVAPYWQRVQILLSTKSGSSISCSTGTWCIANFSGLEHMTNLEEFWANNNQISSWAEVEKLTVNTSLATVYLEHNNIQKDPQYRRKIKLALPTLTQIDATLCR